MATVGELALTLNDYRKRQGVGGKIDEIIEVLAASNPILDDMTWMEGTSAEAESRYIIRDHDPIAFEEKKMVLQKCVDFLNGKYGDVITLEIREQYRNMKELIEPHMFLIDNAKAAFRACGVEPIIQPIRGGTDGADLTFKGIPCPNLSTGGMNFHSNTEYMPVQSMEKMADVLLELVRVK